MYEWGVTHWGYTCGRMFRERVWNLVNKSSRNLIHGSLFLGVQCSTGQLWLVILQATNSVLNQRWPGWPDIRIGSTVAQHEISMLFHYNHYNDVIMSAMASHITSLTTVYSGGYSGADERKHHSSALLAFVGGIHRWPVNSPHKGPVTGKMFPFDDVIMIILYNGATPTGSAVIEWIVSIW